MRSLFSSAVLLLLAGGTGQAQDKVNLAYTLDTLPNGLRVVYHVDRGAPLASVVVWYNVGSKHEQPGRTGFAHLFEHMMFQGSKNVKDDQHFRLLERVGAAAGRDINGTTWTDRTNYFESVPPQHLGMALWLESDRMGYLLDAVTPAKLENQREVVKNERRQGVDNQPYGTWFEYTFGYAFPDEHPYHHPVIGSMKDLTAATQEDVSAFFRTYYAPNNAVLVLAGDFDIAEARRLVTQYFGPLPRGPAAPAAPDMSVPALVGREVRAVVPDNVPLPRVYAAFRIPPLRDRDGWYAGEVLARILGDGRSSRLYAALVRDQQVASSVNAFTFGLLDGADLLVVTATAKPGVAADSLERAVLAEIERARLTPPAADEMRRVVNRAQYQLADQLQSLGGFGGRADQLAQYATFFGDPGEVNRLLERFSGVKPDAVAGLARERLVESNRVLLIYVPRQERPREASDE